MVSVIEFKAEIPGGSKLQQEPSVCGDCVCAPVCLSVCLSVVSVIEFKAEIPGTSNLRQELSVCGGCVSVRLNV